MNKSSLEKAQQKYEEKRIVKPISFNSEKDELLLLKINEITKKTGLSFSVWVKQKIQEFE
jgi:hypothetical protein